MQDVENRAHLHFLWQDRKRGNARERPAETETSLLWKTFVITWKSTFLFCPCARREKAGKTVEATHEKKAKSMEANMKRKFLEDLGLDKEIIDKIIDQNSMDIGSYKKQVEELAETNKQLKADVQTRDSQLEELKKAGSVDDLKKQLNEAQEANKNAQKEYDEKIADMKFNAAIEKALADSLHPDLIAKQIDKSKLKLNKDGTIDGLEDQVKTLKEAYKDMFKPDKKGKTPANPEGASKVITKEQFASMKYADRFKIYNENRELYEQLAGGNENG